MNVVFHNRFEKAVQKLPTKVRQKAFERIVLFTDYPLNRQLRNHSLNTPYKGSYSIDIIGNYRAIYELVDNDTALFTHISTHSQLYR